MRTLLTAIGLLFVIMLATPPRDLTLLGITSPDQEGHWVTTPTDGQVAVLMHSPDSVLMQAPNCFIMADGTTQCATDPISGHTVATEMWRKPTSFTIGMRQPAPLIVTTRRPEVAIFCSIRKPKLERPTIVGTHNPTLAISIVARSTVRA